MGIFSDLGFGSVGNDIDSFLNKTVIDPIESFTDMRTSLINTAGHSTEQVIGTTASAVGSVEKDVVSVSDQITQFFPFIALGVGGFVLLSVLK